MKLLLRVAISIWLVILEPSCAADLSFDVTSATKTSYSKLLSDVRDKVKDPKLNYGGTNLPVMAKAAADHYLLVDIKASGGTITFALSKNNLYLDAYLDKFEGNYRAHFFKNAPSTAKKNIFPEAKGDKNRLEMKYENTYASIEKNAQKDRDKLGLGVSPLNRLVDQVYGATLDVRTEAQLMLVVIQMVSEATRFKYIEDMVLNNFAQTYNPDPKMMRLEIRWSKISKGIKTSKNGVISPELDLVDAQGKSWKVSQVKDIVGDMGLFKNEENSLFSLFTKYIMKFMRFFWAILSLFTNYIMKFMRIFWAIFSLFTKYIMNFFWAKNNYQEAEL